MRECDGGETLAIAAIGRAELVPFLDGIALQEVRLLSGCTLTDLREYLVGVTPVSRPILALDLTGSTVQSLRESAIAQLANAVREFWPSAWDGEDFDGIRVDALGLAYLPIRLAELASRLPALSQAWARDAVAALLQGRDPRVSAAADIEWRQLVLMLSPKGVTVVVPLDRKRASDAFVAAVEWLAAQADAAVVVLAGGPPFAGPPWTRLLYGARDLTPACPDALLEPSHDQAGEPPFGPFSEPTPLKTPAILGAPAVEGRPHPLSTVELRLFRSIQADVELKPLFGFNLLVDEASLLRATVDLLWRTGRVAVEIDGAEHRAAAKYRADRDRDHRLMCAGYRVLRLTNEEVAEDCGRAVEKIREVVRLARPEQA